MEVDDGMQKDLKDTYSIREEPKTRQHEQKEIMNNINQDNGWRIDEIEFKKEISESISNCLQENLCFTSSVQYTAHVAITIDAGSFRVYNILGSLSPMHEVETASVYQPNRQSDQTEVKRCVQNAIIASSRKAAVNGDRACLQLEGSVSVVIDGKELIFIHVQHKDDPENIKKQFNNSPHSLLFSDSPPPVEPDDEVTSPDVTTVSLDTDQLVMQLFSGNKNVDEQDLNTNSSPEKASVAKSSSKFSPKTKKETIKKKKIALKANQCKICEKEFRTLKILQNHEKHCKPKENIVEKEEKNHEATVKKEKQNDEKIETSEKPEKKLFEVFQCNECPMKYKIREHFDSHILAHTEEKAFKCGICSKYFRYKGNIKEHFKSHEKKGDMIDIEIALIELNKKPPPKNRPAMCEICNKMFSTGSNLEKHMLIHKGERPFICETCGKAFRRKAHVQEHIKIHTEQKVQFFCDTCGAGFKTKRCYQQHIKLAHTDLRPFKCTICEKGFKRKRNLEDHARAHSEERLHMCDICGMKLKTKRGVEKHIEVVHCNDKKFACGVCGKQFALKRYVDVHMLVHSNKRNEICETCGAQFKDHRALRQHRITHSGIRPFKCDICEKAFSRKRHLQDHSITHEDKKPEICQLCGKGFRHRGLLANHHRLHKSEKENHACPVCAKIFSPKCRLVRHVKKVHKAISKEILQTLKLKEKDREEIIVISETKFENTEEKGQVIGLDKSENIITENSVITLNMSENNVITLDAESQEQLQQMEGIPMTFIITQGFPEQEFEVAANVQLQDPGGTILINENVAKEEP